MDRWWEGNSLGSPPSVGSGAVGYPTDGIPGTQQPTTPGAWWHHQITEEQRFVISSAGLTPDHTLTSQLAAAINLLAASQADARISAEFAASLGASGWQDCTDYSGHMWFRVFHEQVETTLTLPQDISVTYTRAFLAFSNKPRVLIYEDDTLNTGANQILVTPIAYTLTGCTVRCAVNGGVAARTFTIMVDVLGR